MVGVAVRDVGLVTNGDLGTDLVTNVVVVTDLLVLDVNVGVDLVEFNNVTLENVTKILTHCVVELDGYLASVITVLGHNKIRDGGLLSASSKSECVETESQKENYRDDDFFHWICSFLLYKFLSRNFLSLDTAS